MRGIKLVKSTIMTQLCIQRPGLQKRCASNLNSILNSGSINLYYFKKLMHEEFVFYYCISFRREIHVLSIYLSISHTYHKL